MRSRLLITLVFALWFTLGCSQTATVLPAKAPGKYAETLTVNGRERKFTLTVPKAYGATKPLPLVVLLHGWGSKGATMEGYTGFAAKAEKEGFFLATPEGLGQYQGWNVGFLDLSGEKQDESAFISSLLDQVSKEVGVDAKRVYLAGHSNGAMLANYLGAKLSDRIAAIGSVAGTIGLPVGENRLIPEPKQPISVMLIHGRLDNMVAYEATAKALLRGIGAEDSAKWWAKQDGITGPPMVTPLDKGSIETFAGGRNGTEVVLITLDEGHHDWPGGVVRERLGIQMPLNATDLLWDFFAKHPKP